MNEPKSILFRLQFIDLLKRPFSGLYHEVRRASDKYAISAGDADAKGRGVWIKRPVGTVLEVSVKHPITHAMFSLKPIAIQAPTNDDKKKGQVYTLQAPFYIERITTQSRDGATGDYRRHTHTVQKGETLQGIAKQYNTAWQILHQLNKSTIKDADKIQVGQIIKIPPKNSGLRGDSSQKQASAAPSTNPYRKPKITSADYTIEQGDTLGSIAQRSGKSINELQRLNGIQDPNKIKVGQRIKTGLPSTATPPAQKDSLLGKSVENIAKSTKPSPSKQNTQQSSSASQAGQKAGAAAGAAIITTQNKQTTGSTGTAKVEVASSCATNPACITNGRSELIREVNIRLAGFGGALPTDEFTSLTEKCIKQFQRDYMKAPETGKICGSLLVALDKFNKEYPVAGYTRKMPCPCGVCGGYGKGRPSGKTGIEYPGIHRSLIWILKALEFYLTNEYKARNLSVAYIDSGYRCIDNNKQKGRTTVNHMGLALDIHFNKKGQRTRELNDMEFARTVMAKKMQAQEQRKTNTIYLEPKRFNNGSTGATTWVHYDITRYDKDQYIRKLDFKQTVNELVGQPLLDLIKGSAHSNLMSCSGMIHKPSIRDENKETLFLTKQDIIDIMKVTETEVIKFKEDRYFNDQAAGVIDTILNRVQSKYWGQSVRSVVNAYRQFTKITGPAKYEPYGSVQAMPFSAVSNRMRRFVKKYLIERANGKPSIVGEHLNYANKYHSDSYNRKAWVDSLHNEAEKSGLIFGVGKSIHAHGTVKELVKHKPKPFIIVLPLEIEEI